MRNKPVVVFYVLSLVAVAAVFLWWLLPQYPITADQWIPLLCFAAFTICVDFFAFRTSSGPLWLPSATVDLAVIAVFGPAVAALMEAIGVIVGDGLIKRRPLIKNAFNLAALTLSAGIAGVVFHALPWSGDLSHPAFLVPALVAHLVFAAINMSLTSSVMAVSGGQTLRAVWSRDYGWHFLSAVVAAPSSAFLIFSYHYAGLWSLLLFALPLFIIYRNHKLFQEMKEAHINTVAALTTALEADEPYTHGHSYRVARYAMRIGREMGMNPRELEILEYGSLLHDIGKIAITNDIVCKPARLTREEFDILAAHAAIGGEIVSQMTFLEEAAELVRNHHERPDRQGYPAGLGSDQTSLGSYIIGVCDAIDAMTSNRPYRAALTLEECVEEVKKERGTQFDERVVDTLVAMVEEGSFELIPQHDGRALEIQRILREAPQAVGVLKGQAA